MAVRFYCLKHHSTLLQNSLFVSNRSLACFLRFFRSLKHLRVENLKPHMPLQFQTLTYRMWTGSKLHRAYISRSDFVILNLYFVVMIPLGLRPHRQRFSLPRTTFLPFLHLFFWRTPFLLPIRTMQCFLTIFVLSSVDPCERSEFICVLL